MTIYTFLVTNENIINLITNFLGMVFTISLTGIIISQTSKNSRKQLELTKNINQQQSSIQKRQIKVDIYPYKREIYVHLTKVYEFTNTLNDLLERIDLKIKSGKDIFGIYQNLQKQFVPDVFETLWRLRESKYILPSSICNTIDVIRTNFDEIQTLLYSFNLYSEILTTEEFEKIKISNLEKIEASCKSILRKRNQIESQLIEELNISNLEK